MMLSDVEQNKARQRLESWWEGCNIKQGGQGKSYSSKGSRGPGTGVLSRGSRIGRPTVLREQQGCWNRQKENRRRAGQCGLDGKSGYVLRDSFALSRAGVGGWEQEQRWR
jgi:hypothetical protein